MAQPSQRTEGVSKPSNQRQELRFSLEPDGETCQLSKFVNQIVEEGLAPQGTSRPVELWDIVYPDFATLIDEASKDESVAGELNEAFHQGLLAIQHRYETLEVIRIVDREWMDEITMYRNEVLELREALVKANQDTVTANQKAADWKMQYADAVLQRTIAIQAPSPSPSQFRPEMSDEESPEVEEVSSRPVRPIRPVREHVIHQVDTSDCEPVAPQKPKTKRRKAIADPEIFSDIKTVDYETWEIKMQDKLDYDAEDYRTEKEKIAYIFSRTTGRAAKILLQYIKPGPLQVTTAVAAFEALSACFQDHHRVSKAWAAFKKLRFHEGGDYHIFYTKFTELALVGEVAASSYKRELADRLPDSIRVHLLGPELDDEVDFNEYQKLASKIANGRALLDDQKTVRFEKPKRVPYPKESATTSTNWQVKKEPTEVALLARPRSTDTSDPSSSKCFNCNQKGHRAKDCPIKPKVAAITEASDDEGVTY